MNLFPCVVVLGMQEILLMEISILCTTGRYVSQKLSWRLKNARTQTGRDMGTRVSRGSLIHECQVYCAPGTFIQGSLTDNHAPALIFQMQALLEPTPCHRSLVLRAAAKGNKWFFFRAAENKIFIGILGSWVHSPQHIPILYIIRLKFLTDLGVAQKRWQ